MICRMVSPSREASRGNILFLNCHASDGVPVPGSTRRHATNGSGVTRHSLKRHGCEVTRLVSFNERVSFCGSFGLPCNCVRAIKQNFWAPWNIIVQECIVLMGTYNTLISITQDGEKLMWHCFRQSRLLPVNAKASRLSSAYQDSLVSS